MRGISIGETRGISIGETRGIRQRNVELVIKCYHRGKSVVDIADITDLPVDEVQDIIGNLT
jgi:predicted methyltransferase